MDDFRLYGFSDDVPFLIPLGPFAPFEPSEPTEDNQLAGPALPLQHPDIRDNDELLPEVQYCSSIHYRFGIVNPPQELPHLVRVWQSPRQGTKREFLLYLDVNSCRTRYTGGQQRTTNVPYTNFCDLKPRPHDSASPTR
jgi:hypothetical protein